VGNYAGPRHLDEINHYMKVAKVIKLTIEVQKKIDEEK